jgi:hypothetical protein
MHVVSATSLKQINFGQAYLDKFLILILMFNFINYLKNL